MEWNEKEEWQRKFLEVLAGFRLLDDAFMTVVFQDSFECVDLLLQIVMARPTIQTTKVITQDTLKNLLGRSVRLDIHAFSEGQEFDVEVQRADDGASPKRARYNASLMDAVALRAGEDFDNLPESYVIFITERDVLGYGRPIYRIRRIIEEENEAFGDGSHIIYVNSAIMDEDTPLGRLMHDFHCTRAEDMYYDVLAERVRYFKETEEGVSKMSKAMEELARDFAGEFAREAEKRGEKRGMQRGMQRGMETERIFSIRNIMANLQLTAEKAMDVLAIPKAEQERYKAML